MRDLYNKWLYIYSKVYKHLLMKVSEPHVWSRKYLYIVCLRKETNDIKIYFTIYYALLTNISMKTYDQRKYAHAYLKH